MAAYVIAEHKITNASKFEEYKSKVGPMMAKYGGRYLTKGDSLKMPEGGHWTPAITLRAQEGRDAVCTHEAHPPA